MNKKIAIVIIMIIAIAGIYLLWKSPRVQAPTIETSQVSNTKTSLTTTENNKETATTSQPANQNVITYTNIGYAPNTFTIQAGETIIYKNNSSLAMWPASAMHPTHAVYPTTGGCLGSTFDACKGIQPGESWSFKFDVAGNWKYHDHLKPSFFGTIIVK